MDRDEVKNDLKEIQFYYANRRDVQSNLREVGNNGVLFTKIQRYNELIKTAPIQLHNLYVSIYVNNNSQIVYAEDMGVSPKTIQRLNHRLIDYLCAQFNCCGENSET